MQKEWFKNRLLLFSILFIILIYLFCLISFSYGDMLTTTLHSLKLIEETFKGNFWGFYEKTLLPLDIDWICPAVYDIEIYIILAIWNIPIYLIQGGSARYLSSPLAILWSHLIYIIFMFGVMYYLKKLLQKQYQSKEAESVSVILFSSSLLVIMSVLFVGQVEIISLFFIMQGIFYYLEDNPKKFYLSFAIAGSIKLFAFFLFIPLVLLKEKNLYKLTWNMFKGGSVLLITKILFWNNEGYRICQSSLNETILNKLNHIQTPVLSSKASLFIAAFVFLCIFAYYQYYMEDLKFEQTIWISYSALALFFLFANVHPYWLILLVPFQVLILFLNSEHFKLNLLLEITSSISWTIIFVITTPHCYSADLLDRTFLKYLPMYLSYTERKYNSIYAILEQVGIYKYFPWIHAILLSSVIAIIMINFPFTKKTKEIKDNITELLIENRKIIIFRLMLPLLLIGGIVYCITVKKNTEMVNTYNEEDRHFIALSDTDNSVKQMINFNNKWIIDNFELIFIVPEASYINTESIKLEFWDIDNNNLIYSSRKSINSIKNWIPVSFDTKDIEVLPGNNYCISIYLLNRYNKDVQVIGTSPSKNPGIEMELYAGQQKLNESLQIKINGTRSN